MGLIINVRSGIINGIFEAIALLILAPVITRGTAKIYNLMTTHRIFAGQRVRICDDSMAIEDIIPRLITFIRTVRNRASSSQGNVSPGISRQFVTLLISLLMSVGILLISVYTDGKTVPMYQDRDLFLWNNGSFVDTTPSTGLDGRAGDVIGMFGVRLACINRTDTASFKLYSVGFNHIQRFRRGRSANGSVCLNGEQTRETQGITLRTNRVFNPPTDPVRKEDMQGQPAQFQFISSIDRKGAPDYCRVLVTTRNISQEWTMSSEELLGKTRFAVRAIRNESNEIIVRVGVAYHFLDSDEVQSRLGMEREDCEAISSDMFASNRFIASITEMGTTLNLAQLELVLADMLMLIVGTGYGRLESQEIMLRSYYAGILDSDEDSDTPLGTFIPMRVAVFTGEQQVTELSALALVGAAVTAFGTAVLLGVAVCVRPKVRLTSPAYVSQLYACNLSPNGRFDVKEWDYIEAVEGCRSQRCVRPLSLAWDAFDVHESAGA